MENFTKNRLDFGKIALWILTTTSSIIDSIRKQNVVKTSIRSKKMADEILDEVMIKGTCKGKADAIVNCQCNIETAPNRCEQAEKCMFYSYYKCSKQWKRLA
jgi:hypothetical protein